MTVSRFITLEALEAAHNPVDIIVAEVDMLRRALPCPNVKVSVKVLIAHNMIELVMTNGVRVQ